MQPPQPPQDHQPQPISAQYPQPSFAALPTPPRRHLRVLVTVAVLAVVAIIVLSYVFGVYLPAAQEAARQPKITLTNALYSTSGCGLFDNQFYTYAWTFTLVNTGSADGFATVRGYVDANPVGEVTYFVPQGTSVDKGFSIDSPDCGSHWTAVLITTVTKA